MSVDVGTDAVYAMPLAPGGCGLGDPVGPDADAAALSDRRLTPVADPALAIGRAAEAVGPAAREVRVTFAGAFSTGSAHAALTHFWAHRLGRDSFTAFQASGRGGHATCRLEGDRAWLGGQCVTVVEGSFYLSG